MNLSSFISDYRLSQREIADILGCSTTNMSNLVTGKRRVTGMHVRLLIDRFGYDVISKYADPGEMPVAPVSNVNISMPKISGNTAPVQNGDNNTLSADPALVDIINKQTSLLEKKDEQIDRLLSLLEVHSKK